LQGHVKMVTLSGYRLTDLIYETSRTQIYRGKRQSDQRAVVVKLLQAEYPTLRDLVQFRNQYAITKSLNLPGVVQSYSLDDYHNGFALVMEDFGGISLRDYFHHADSQIRSPQRPSSSLSDFASYQGANLNEVLAAAIQLVQILEGLARHHVVHKDIKPQHILISPNTLQIKLIDFSIASLLPKEKQEIQNPNVLEGTLAYMSPEQTGRMNRGIDYRTDFYSLGVTLYELLTGQLPFSSDDPLEVVHGHLARQPIPPILLNSAIPPVVNNIILKLMAKTAEERYQSALGLRHDLEHCLEQHLTLGKVDSFQLGTRDISDRFHISEKLYGRESEVAAGVWLFRYW
jgi:serine/threonine protein kinase